MALASNSLIRQTKIIADQAAQIVNGQAKSVLEVLDIQNVNVFSIAIFPSNLNATVKVSAEEEALRTAGKQALSTLTALGDTTIANLHIINLDIPFIGFTYETYNEEKAITDLEYPEEVSITFIESEIGTVRAYLNAWMSSIITKDPFSEHKQMVFRDDQTASKKDAIIIPQTGLSAPSTGWIKLMGLKLKNVGNITIGHDETGPLKLSATFAVDKVWWFVPGPSIA
jgi:hypothetical protein